MTENLPEVIKDRLKAIIAEEEFSDDVELNIGKITNSEIGSSCFITIKATNKKLRLFVKYLLGSQSDFSVQAVDYFNNETVFYSEIVGQFKGKLISCVPKCYGVGRDETLPFTIMEDLEGYEALGKAPVSVDLLAIILEQLGRLHGNSFAIKDELRSAAAKLRETVFAHDSPYRKIFVHAIHDSFKLLKRSLPEDSFYLVKFADFLLGVFDRLGALSQEDEEWKVVTHGDLWPNNILYNPETKSIKFIDFQGCRYSSPVHDLMLVLLVGLDKSSRGKHREELIKIYHNSLCGTLEEYGLDPLRLFPISVLKTQIARHSRFALGVALAGLALYFNEGQVVLSSQSEGGEQIFEFMEEVRRNMSLRCKSKILEIIMDVVDNEGL